MGMTRKALSMSSMGLIDFRSDKERTARSTRRTDKAVRSQTKLLKKQPAPVVRVVPGPPADGHAYRWDGFQWVEADQL